MTTYSSSDRVVKHNPTRRLAFAYSIVVATVVGLAMLPLSVTDAHAGGKRDVERNDYVLWHDLLMPAERSAGAQGSISPDGKWIAYLMEYDSNPGMNRLEIRRLGDGATHRLPGAQAGRFSPDGRWYVYRTADDGVGIFNLENGRSESVQGATSFEFAGDSSVIVAHVSAEQATEGRIVLVNLVNGGRRTIDGVDSMHSYATSPHGREVAYVSNQGQRQSVEIVDTTSSDPAKTVIASANGGFDALTWDKSGQALAFVQQTESEGARLFYFRRSDAASSRKLDSVKLPETPTGYSFSDGPLLVSDDLRFVLLDTDLAGAAEGKEAQTPTPVEVWNARARNFPDARPKAWRSKGNGSMTLAWWPGQKKLVTLAAEGQSFGVLTGDQKFALVFASRMALLPDGYELDYSGLAADVYLVDVSNGDKKRILERQDVARNHNVQASPGGRYVAYFRDGQWWTYDIRRDVHTKVSGRADRSLVEPWPASGPFTNSWANVPYGSPGWLGNDAGLIFYDEFDLWRVSPDGGDLRRMTEGREKGIKYRIQMPEAFPRGHIHVLSSRFGGVSYGLDQELMLSSFGDRTKKSGYSVWKDGAGLYDLVYDDAWLDFIEPVPGTTSYVYRQQRFDLPPELVMVDRATGAQEVLVRSNPQHGGFNWGRVELVEYPAAHDRTLQGLLYYPAGYKAGEKYPMIVKVYEDQSHRLHRYVSPSDTGRDPTGHYPANFTTNGYFVLLPDILSYEGNEPGITATECVVAAVNHVLEMGVVKRDAIGLAGHSFGGYETNFIITQTNLFSAAVAGSGITDLVSYYLSNIGYEPDIYAFEYQQFRMNGPFYRDKTNWLANSPIHNAERINTPLLSWSGSEDLKVPVEQSIFMFNLLRRMNKEHVLLVYPDEGHVLWDRKNGADLYDRTMAWFDHYLKKKPAEDWMVGDRDMTIR